MGNETLVGMLHLPPLPGAPGGGEPLGAIEQRVLREAAVLRDAGFDAAILENFGDVPFFKRGVPPITIAAMTRLATAVRREAPELELGVNVLRNDARAALAVAAASGASFIRVNVHVGATATDQGIVEGRAARTLRERAALRAEVAIWTDVHVKHGRSLAHETIAAEAEDAVRRGLADAVIVSGTGTGKPTSVEDLRIVRDLRLGVPLIVGSGVAPETAASFLALADGLIVGTSIKRDGRTSDPIDPERAKVLVARVREADSS